MLPSVVSFENDETITLSCIIAGYYPLDVSVSWTQRSPEHEAEIRLSDTRFSSHRQSQDGTYSITSYLSLSSTTAQAPATYTCHVSHVALEEPISVSAHLKAPGKCQGRRDKSFVLPGPPTTSSPTTRIKISEMHHTCLFLPALLLVSSCIHLLFPSAFNLLACISAPEDFSGSKYLISLRGKEIL